jgi:catechol 2,3-dioxygenase-like lactoylglutathione lyase family enzyme
VLDHAKIVCFAATANPDSAKQFYTEVLGLTLVEDSPFALVLDANGTGLRLQKVPALVPAAYTSIGWDVDDIRATIQQLVGKGVGFERYAGLEQDDLGVWKSPSGMLVAWFKDPDGNTLSLAQQPAPHTA